MCCGLGWAKRPYFSWGPRYSGAGDNCGGAPVTRLRGAWWGELSLPYMSSLISPSPPKRATTKPLELSVFKLFIYKLTVMISAKSCFEQKNAWSRFALIGYCLNCTNFGKLILMKIVKIVVTRQSYFSAEIHQVRFRLRPLQNPLPSLQRSALPIPSG